MDSNIASNRSSKLGKRSFSQLANEIAHEPDEYHFFKSNEAFSIRYVEDYVNTLLESEFIPDILMDVVGEMTDKSKIYNPKDYNIPLESDIFIKNTDQHNKIGLIQSRYDESHLLSDNIVNSLSINDKRFNKNQHNSQKLHISKKHIDSDLYNQQNEYKSNINHTESAGYIPPLSKNNHKSYQATTNSASIFDFEPSQISKQSIRKEISQELKEIGHTRNVISSTQNYVAEDLISKTLQSDILRDLANETLEEERKKNYSRQFDDIDNQYDLKNVHDLIYKKSELEDNSLV